MMIFKDTKNIILNKELSELDTFTLDFIAVIQKHTPYVIISGYVAILLGRSRASEDIDMIIPRLNKEKTQVLYHDLIKHGFYCLTEKDIYSYLDDNIAVRFAKKKTVIPNMELKFAKNKIDTLTLKDSIQVHIQNAIITISPLELQIAYKEEILKSDKDIEDARHIRNIAQKYITSARIEGYKRLLHGVY